MRAQLCLHVFTIGVWSLLILPADGEITEHEKWAAELRKSDERPIQLLGERWYGLVKLQEWKDATGKYSVNAKYVSHDDGFTSVTLLTIRRTDQGRQERQVKVPFDKLDKMAQARVRRIGKLKPLIEQRQQEVAAAREEEEATADDAMDRGRGPTGEEGFVEARPAANDREFGGRENPVNVEQGGGRPPLPDGRGSGRPARPPMEEPGSTVSDMPMTEQPVGGRVPTAETPAYAVPLEYVAEDFPLERDTDSGEWQEFYEPIGDESHLELRLVPAEPVAGETAKLLVIASSIYGRPQPRTYVRIGNPAMPETDVSRSPNGGPPWAEMTFVGGRIQNLESEQMVPLGETRELADAEQPGESFYLIGLQLPPGKSVIDLKFEDEQLGTFALRVLEVDAAPASPGRGDPRLLR